MGNRIKTLSAYLECSVITTARVERLKEFIDILAKMGYNEFYLGLTDAYKVENYPYFNYKRGHYTKDELLDLEKYASERGVTLVPAIQVLGHLEYIWRHGVFQDMMDTRCILEVGNEKAYAFVEAMIKSISESFKGRRIHVGMDETFGIGTGNYLKHNAPKDKKALVLEYLKKVVEIAKKYNIEIEMWGDMLLEREGTNVTPDMVKAELPKNTLVWQWDYDTKDKKKIRQKVLDIKKHADKFGFAGSAWKIASYAPSNQYSIERLINQIEVCGEEGVTNYMVTLWGDNGIPCSMFSVLPSLFIASEFNQRKDVSKSKLDKEKFKKIVGVSYDDVYSLEYLSNPWRRKQPYLCSMSFLVMFSDLFVGNYDLVISEGINKKFKSLANKYRKIDGGVMSHTFKEASALADVLALKAFLGKRIREAYKANEKETLKFLVDHDLTKLIKKMKVFNKVFDEFALHEWQPLGLEANQIWHNAVIGRLEFIKMRLLSFINNNEKLEEIEEETLPPSYIPPISEDSYILNWHQWLFSYCMK